MPDVHTIRLHGPWQIAPQSAIAGEPPVEQTLRMPGDFGPLLGPAYEGAVQLKRRFHRPTGLDSGEQVWLVIEGVEPCGQALLNGQRLGEVATACCTASARFEITEQLQPNNELVIEVRLAPGDQATARLIGPIRLEIQDVE